MADDQNRAPKTTVIGNTARAAARSTVAPQRSAPDPLVELARLIGQTEGSAVASAYEAVRPVARRRDQANPAPRLAEPPAAEPRGAEARKAAPRQTEPLSNESRAILSRLAEPPTPFVQPRAERPVGRGAAENQHHPDQSYDGYADPQAPDLRAAQVQRSDPPQVRRDGPGGADPYQTEAGWRAPGKRVAARREMAGTPRRDLAFEQEIAAAAPHFAAPAARMPVQTESPRFAAGRSSAAAPAAARAPIAAEPVAPPRAPAAASRAAVATSRAPMANDPGSAAHAAAAPASLEDLQQAYQRYAPASGNPYYSDDDDYDDRQRSAAAQDEYGRDAYYDEDAYNYSGTEYEDQRYSNGRRKLGLALALVALAVIGTGGAYAIRTMFAGSSHSGPPPIIEADTSPKKIAAAQPGDKQIQDRLGDRSDTERMVSREEKPLAVKDPNAPPLVPGVGSSAEPPAVSAPATTSAAMTDPGTPEASKPKRIRTVTIRPENEPAAASPGASGIPAASPVTTRTVPPADPAGAAPQAAPPLPSPAPPTRTATAEPPPRTSSRVNPGDYMVQLSAQKSESDAKSSFRILQSKYASVLRGRELYIQRKDLGRRGVYYGAQVGPFGSRGEAVQLCEDLKAAGGTCLVQRN